MGKSFRTFGELVDRDAHWVSLCVAAGRAGSCGIYGNEGESSVAIGDALRNEFGGVDIPTAAVFEANRREDLGGS